MVFGDCLRLQDEDEIKDYVFLGTPSEGGSVYLARIPNIITSKRIMELDGRLAIGAQTGRVNQRLNSDLFFFVELTTKEFEQRIVLLTSTDYPEIEMQKYLADLKRLDGEDIAKIKKKIMEASNNSVSPKLKEIIHSLDGEQ